MLIKILHISIPILQSTDDILSRVDRGRPPKNSREAMETSTVLFNLIFLSSKPSQTNIF